MDQFPSMRLIRMLLIAVCVIGLMGVLARLARGADAHDSFLIRGDSSTVIQWLTTNRDILIRQGGARVMRHEGPSVIVSRDGIEVRLHESSRRWSVSVTDQGNRYVEITPSAPGRPAAASYHVALMGASRKLRSWTTDISITPYSPGWTWITITASASVYGPGEGRVQAELTSAVDRVKSYIRGVFR
jgi:hypothetical protein